MCDIGFRGALPAHAKYGFGKLQVGSETKVAIRDMREATLIRSAISGYSQYHGKRFKTYTDDDFLYIKRVK